MRGARGRQGGLVFAGEAGCIRILLPLSGPCGIASLAGVGKFRPPVLSWDTFSASGAPPKVSPVGLLSRGSERVSVRKGEQMDIPPVRSIKITAEGFARLNVALLVKVQAVSRLDGVVCTPVAHADGDDVLV